ncbi:MAG: hypothetical protein ACOX2P_09395 [Bacillota bacterium]|jgi:hypothetical protein
MKKKYRSIHIIKCEKCGCSIKVFCQLRKGCYSQKPLECPQCNYFAGWITSSPGYEVERLVSVIQESVSGY